MHNFKELIVWQRSVDFVNSVYGVTKTYPTTEKHNLISQMEPAATSIPLNIAEGCGRHTNPLFKQFLGHALGSSYELETAIIISKNLGYVNEQQKSDLTTPLVSIQRMLNKLMDTL